VPKFVSIAASTAELAREEKIVYSTQSINHSIKNPAYLMPQEPKLSLQNINIKTIY